MARLELLSTEGAAIGGMVSGSDMFVRLGLMYASGRSVELDRIAAHMWFNIAALKGDRDAVQLRREISGEMTSDEISAAQRAAREWISAH